ncbi:A.superbus venom factor 1-like [Hippocampus comes]|uniref:A.superbus venom factor 1-like n=1 Tax=Hippocampus comes TaxID=109280 RepID=UPI00094E5571|nr:PREDICTED: A.superbus venom factor 1-like [Hippocampus comes]
MGGRKFLRWTILLCLLCAVAARGSLRKKLSKALNPRRILQKLGLSKSTHVAAPSIPQTITVPEPPPDPVEVPRFTLVAPNLLRTDSPENIFLQAEGIASPVEVIISVTDFTKTTMLFTGSRCTRIPSGLLNRDEIKNKYVIVKVKFGNYHEEERTVMVSFHSGYIFIQTDKPIYNPGDEG